MNELNFFENKKFPRTRNLIPHNSKLNNYKSNKYFTIEENTNLMKEALTKYRETQKFEKNNSINTNNNCNNTNNNTNNNSNNTNKSLHSIRSTADITNIIKGKQKFNKNNTIKLDKNILFFAEPNSRIQEFHKINPKVIDSITIDNLDNNNDSETIRENYNNIDKRNIIYKKSRINDYNKNIKIKLQKNIKKFDITANISNNDETFLNENEEEESETIYYESDYHKVDYSIFDKNNNNKINLERNSLKFFDEKNINYEYLLMIEKLFNDLMKDIEINKLEKYINKLSVIKDFLFIFNDEENFKIIDEIDSNIIKNNNNIFLLIKEYFILQMIFFHSFILIELIKNKNDFFSGLQNLIFYFHQNFIIVLFLIITNLKHTSNNYSNIQSTNNKNECIKIITGNKTWLDKTDFKEYLLTNNKISKQTLINLLNQIQSYFHSNNYNANYLHNISSLNKRNNNHNNIIDSITNLFLSKISDTYSQKLSDIFKELKTFPSINYLIELINLNKIQSNYSLISPQEVYEFDTEELNNYKEDDTTEFKIEENDSIITPRKDLELKPQEPYLNQINPKYKYTLVLDLDETLVHYISDNDSAYIQIRPGTEDFLIDLAKYYEIVIFTAALQKYADIVINSIDPNNVISYRLYRQHTISIGNSNVKDLTKLGRDLRYVIIVDNCLENFAMQSRNGLKIIDFEGNEFDDELEYLKEDLIKLVKMNVNDVRDYLEKIQINMDKRANFYQKINFNNNNNNYNNELVNYDDNQINLFREVIKEKKEYNNINKNSQKENARNRYSYNYDND